MKSTRKTSLLLGIAASITLAACGSSDASISGQPSPTTPTTVTSPPTFSPTTTAPAPTTTAIASAIDQATLSSILDEHFEAGEFVGARLSFRDSDGTTTQVSTGTQTIDADSAEVDVDVPWGIGSITKTFVAVVVMQLVEEGRLDLDAPIDRYFPDLLDAETITPRQLLQHTSGLGEYFDRPAVIEDRQRPWTTEELIAVAEANGRFGRPDGEYHYTNTGFIVLGDIIEQITGRSWPAEVEARIVEPLGLEHTGLIDPASAPGYDPIEGSFVLNTRIDPSIGGAAGALESTDADLLRYVAAFFDGTLLTPESLVEMKAFVPGDDLPEFGIVVSAGLGFERWETDTVTLFGHLGSSDAHSAFIGFDEEHGTAVAVTINSQAPGPQAFIAIEALSSAADR